jgi:membrane protein DedA with SNARE-associated domain
MREEALRKQLIAAGFYRVPPRRFIGYQLLAAFTLGLGLVWLTALAGSSGAAIFFFGFFGLVLGWVGPRFVVGRRPACASSRSSTTCLS